MAWRAKGRRGADLPRGSGPVPRHVSSLALEEMGRTCLLLLSYGLTCALLRERRITRGHGGVGSFPSVQRSTALLDEGHALAEAKTVRASRTKFPLHACMHHYIEDAGVSPSWQLSASGNLGSSLTA